MESDLTLRTLEILKSYHVFFLFIVPVVFVLNLLYLYTQKNYASLNKKIWFSMPLLFSLYAVGFVLGIVIWAMLGFTYQGKILLMLFVWTIFLVGEIIRSKKLKIMRLSQEGMERYIAGCKIFYILALAVYLVSIGVFLL
ncbi:hypothetical protein [Helicobacter anatolicus]|uniref:hypothetical protein n=1 Tax=Helicobacter anatolicus TaxID=2905874 RepID=UPI001E50E68F|nr:hypothetical protein [Helicobacter anatolicus]MCE3038929.1 hypothetical protein [Helicobacter anatolicus]